jgi:hypothetical protein
MKQIIEGMFQDTYFYGKVDLSELDEDVFGKWFIKTFGEVPIVGDRLPDPEFQGLACRYGK